MPSRQSAKVKSIERGPVRSTVGIQLQTSAMVVDVNSIPIVAGESTV
jgi:molybdopterin-binding protein